VAATEVTIQVNMEGLEQVNAGFNQIGNAAENAGDRVASSAQNMTVQMDLFGNKVKESTAQMEVSNRRLILSTAGVIANSVQLGDIMSRMASGQMDVGRGALMLGMNFLQLGAQLMVLDQAYTAVIAKKITSIALGAQEVAADIAAAAAKGAHTAASWALTLAEKARAVASAIAHGVSTLGVAVPLIIAAAAVATAGVLAAQASIPSRQLGGPVFEEGPHWLHPEEYVETPIERRNITEVLRRVETLREFPFAAPKTVYVAAGAITINESKTPRETADAVIDGLRRAGAV